MARKGGGLVEAAVAQCREVAQVARKLAPNAVAIKGERLQLREPPKLRHTRANASPQREAQAATVLVRALMRPSGDFLRATIPSVAQVFKLRWAKLGLTRLPIY